MEQWMDGPHWGDLQRRVELSEDCGKRYKENIRQLFAQDEGRKAHLMQILTCFDATETRSSLI